VLEEGGAGKWRPFRLSGARVVSFTVGGLGGCSMKFATLEAGQLGAVVEERALDLVQAAHELGEGLAARTLLDLTRAGETAAIEAWALAQRAAARNLAARPLEEVRPRAPIPMPIRNIFCLGKNYRDHVRELGEKVDASAELPEAPIVFTKATRTVIGPGDPIPAHGHATQMVDYEAELALIIGKDGEDIPPERAWEHVFGYTAINDVTARDLQIRHKQWFLGKSLRGFAPMGPYVVHRLVMAPPDRIRIRSWVNGEARQDATFDQLIFDVPTIVATLSRGAPLLAGDIIATGTPAGVGMGFKPPRFLKPGDEVSVEVTGAGRLTNRVVA